MREARSEEPEPARPAAAGPRVFGVPTGAHIAARLLTNLDSRTAVEIIELFQELNDNGLTIVLVTHEPDISQFAKRVIVFKDGKIRKDEPAVNRPRAQEVLKTLPTLED